MPLTAPPIRSRFSSRLSIHSSMVCTGSSIGGAMIFPGKKGDVVFGQSTAAEARESLPQPLHHRGKRQSATGAQDVVEPLLAKILARRRPAFDDAVRVEENPVSTQQ